VFWELTLREVEAVVERRAEQERRRDLRAGLIAATLVNVNRRRGSRLVQPQDFFRTGRKPEDFLTVEQATKAMDRWAEQHNASKRRIIGPDGGKAS
jgi:hypothetical protein